MLRRCLILASLLAAPAAARAQFATFIPPKPKPPDSVVALTAAAQKTKADSASAARIRNMKLWVDSAAGLPPRPSHGADTVLTAIDTAAPPVLVATAHRPVSPPAPVTPERPAPTNAKTSVRSGARAPATASDLPLLLVVGSLSLVIGVVLIAGSPRVRGHA